MNRISERYFIFDLLSFTSDIYRCDNDARSFLDLDCLLTIYRTSFSLTTPSFDTHHTSQLTSATTMFGSRNIPDNFVGTNGDWYGTDGEYPAGMMWEGTMFTAGRNEVIWGPQDPLEVIGRRSCQSSTCILHLLTTYSRQPALLAIRIRLLTTHSSKSFRQG